MTKGVLTHINKNGNAAVCQANKRKCPYNASSHHQFYNTASIKQYNDLEHIVKKFNGMSSRFIKESQEALTNGTLLSNDNLQKAAEDYAKSWITLQQLESINEDEYRKHSNHAWIPRFTAAITENESTGVPATMIDVVNTDQNPNATIEDRLKAELSRGEVNDWLWAHAQNPRDTWLQVKNMVNDPDVDEHSFSMSNGNT
jgi:hypothetical protein